MNNILIYGTFIIVYRLHFTLKVVVVIIFFFVKFFWLLLFQKINFRYILPFQ